MKKRIAWVLALVFCLSLTGCFAATKEEGRLLKDGKVEKVSVTSLPEGYAYSFGGEDAQAVVNYFSGLNLIADFPENPDGYSGMTWVVSLTSEGGDVVTVYHFGNTCIRAEDGPWYKMTYEEASRFGSLLDELAD